MEEPHSFLVSKLCSIKNQTKPAIITINAYVKKIVKGQVKTRPRELQLKVKVCEVVNER